MSRPRPTRNNQRRRPDAKPRQPTDTWRTPHVLPEVEPIAVPDEPGALLRSLGDPPMGSGSAAAHYFSAVVVRAAALATALALSADILAPPDDD